MKRRGERERGNRQRRWSWWWSCLWCDPITTERISQTRLIEMYRKHLILCMSDAYKNNLSLSARLHHSLWQKHGCFDGFTGWKMPKLSFNVKLVSLHVETLLFKCWNRKRMWPKHLNIFWMQITKSRRTGKVIFPVSPSRRWVANLVCICWM